MSGRLLAESNSRTVLRPALPGLQTLVSFRPKNENPKGWHVPLQPRLVSACYKTMLVVSLSKTTDPVHCFAAISMAVAVATKSLAALDCLSRLLQLRMCAGS